MSSGGKTLRTNAQERAASNDLNRAQAFAAKNVAETFRYLLDVSCSTDDLDAGAVSAEFLTSASPMRAEILNGLLAQPQIASTAIFIAPGALYCVDPDATPSADDSPYKLVVDPGVAAPGTLTLTSNGAGSARIDVIECQRADYVSESVVRDIFNVSTGLFNASTVTKATQSKLTYRIRAGTAGSGFPGTQAGWLPLAVVSMPAGGATCDDATFWDVRPLLNDRWPSLQSVTARARRLRAFANGLTTSAVAGQHDVAVAGRRLGGRLRRGSPGTDANSIDLTAAANQSTDVASAVNGRIGSVVLLTPFGLPRWARYTDVASGSRIPRSPRGIPVVTSTPMLDDGTPSAPVVFPNAFGFSGASSQSGASVHDFFWSAGAPAATYGDDSGEYVAASAAAKFGTVAGQSYTSSFTAGVDFPANARAVKVSFAIDLTAGSTGHGYAESTVGAPNGGVGTLATNFDVNFDIASGASITLVFSRWIPLASAYPSTTPPVFTIKGLIAGITCTLGAPSMTVVGWRY